MENEIDMIEISVEISPTTTYDIMIPRVITQNTYPEVMKRLNTIYGMIPQDTATSRPSLLKLSEEETKLVINSYETMSIDDFNTFLEENYGIKGKTRGNISNVISKMRSRFRHHKTGGIHGKI